MCLFVTRLVFKAVRVVGGCVVGGDGVGERGREGGGTRRKAHIGLLMVERVALMRGEAAQP